MDSTTAAVTFGSGLLIAAFVQWAKNWVELWIKPGDPRHDSTIQILAALSGAVAFVAHAATLHPLVAQTFWDAAGQGATSGLVAIGAYHIATASPTPAVESGTFAPVHPFSSGGVYSVPTSQIVVPGDTVATTVTPAAPRPAPAAVILPDGVPPPTA